MRDAVFVFLHSQRAYNRGLLVRFGSPVRINRANRFGGFSWVGSRLGRPTAAFACSKILLEVHLWRKACMHTHVSRHRKTMPRQGGLGFHAAQACSMYRYIPITTSYIPINTSWLLFLGSTRARLYLAGRKNLSLPSSRTKAENSCSFGAELVHCIEKLGRPYFVHDNAPCTRRNIVFRSTSASAGFPIIVAVLLVLPYFFSENPVTHDLGIVRGAP